MEIVAGAFVLNIECAPVCFREGRVELPVHVRGRGWNLKSGGLHQKPARTHNTIIRYLLFFDDSVLYGNVMHVGAVGWVVANVHGVGALQGAAVGRSDPHPEHVRQLVGGHIGGEHHRLTVNLLNEQFRGGRRGLGGGIANGVVFGRCVLTNVFQPSALGH